MKQSLKAWRAHVGLTQMELGRLAGISNITISHCERGNTKPDLQTAVAILRALRASGAELSLEDIEFAALSADRNSDSAA